MKQAASLLSVVLVVRNLEAEVNGLLRELSTGLVREEIHHEVIVVDNASSDGTLGQLHHLTAQEQLPNLQVYGLTAPVAKDQAAWHGVEQSLGDHVAVLDLRTDDFDVLRNMLGASHSGTDVVFARNLAPSSGNLLYRSARRIFEGTLKRFGGVDVSKDAPSCRLMNRRVTSYVAQQSDQARSYRLLPATGGFVRTYVDYSGRPSGARDTVGQGFDEGMQLLASTTTAPLRLVALAALFGAVSSLSYSLYVVVLAIVRDDLAEGWISLSLMCSGMFFLISLVLLVLGEYIIHTVQLGHSQGRVHVAREFNSPSLSTRAILNVQMHESDSG